MSRNPRKSNSFVLGVILIVLGALFLLDEMGALSFGDVISTFWPLILIIIGVRIILFPRERRASAPAKSADVESPAGEAVVSEAAAGTLDMSRVFGDVKMRLSNPDFKGGRCSVTFGDIDLDMRDTGLGSGQQTLHLNGVFGDIRLTLPAEIPILIRANTAAGDVDLKNERGEGLFVQRTFKSADFDQAEDRLIIVASVLFGDIRVW